MEIGIPSAGQAPLGDATSSPLFSSPLQGQYSIGVTNGASNGAHGLPLSAVTVSGVSHESIETNTAYANDFDLNLLSFIDNVDTSLFDLNNIEESAASSETIDDEIPELEDVPELALGQSIGSLSCAEGFDQLLMFEEIPELEDVPSKQHTDKDSSSTPTIKIDEAVVTLGDLDCFIEEVEVPFNQTSSSPLYADSCTSPASVSEAGSSSPQSSTPETFVHHQLIIPPSPVPKRRIGRLHQQQPSFIINTASAAALTEQIVLEETEVDAGFVDAELVDDFEGDEMRQRRISQVSVSSYCSSVGVGNSGLWSPASTSSAYSSGSASAASVAGCSYSSTAGSDSEYSCSDNNTNGKRKATAKKGAGGRRSKFSPEDRKERKKAQNRTAAERYRQKRRAADDDVDEVKQRMVDANTELRTEVTKLEAELSCLKRLMREMLQAKGIEIPPPSKKART